MPICFFFFKQTLIKTTALCLCLFLIACGSQAPHFSPQPDLERQQFGAKFTGRSQQSLPLVPVLEIENQSAVINQGDFLTQLSNIRNYSAVLAERFAPQYLKLTNWVLTGANVKDLANFGIQAQLMQGTDGYQNVLMTGYYSPVIQARRSKQQQYHHPIYAMPKKRQFSRAQIYAGVLHKKAKVLAYSNSMLENFLLGVQGSGYVDFGDGNLSYFAYAGQNGFPYTSIGRLLVEEGEIEKEKISIQAIRNWAIQNPSRLQNLLERNQSYVYFKLDPYGKVRGSAGVPLVPMAAVASDRNLIPTGSVLLVEVPELDQQGQWTGAHHLHLMIALDVGGAVKGHHFDLYRGIGEQAGHIAGLSKHYGRVWVLQ